MPGSYHVFTRLFESVFLSNIPVVTEFSRYLQYNRRQKILINYKYLYIALINMLFHLLLARLGFFLKSVHGKLRIFLVFPIFRGVSCSNSDKVSYIRCYDST